MQLAGNIVLGSRQIPVSPAGKLLTSDIVVLLSKSWPTAGLQSICAWIMHAKSMGLPEVAGNPISMPLHGDNVALSSRYDSILGVTNIIWRNSILSSLNHTEFLEFCSSATINKCSYLTNTYRTSLFEIFV